VRGSGAEGRMGQLCDLARWARFRSTGWAGRRAGRCPRTRMLPGLACPSTAGAPRTPRSARSSPRRTRCCPGCRGTGLAAAWRPISPARRRRWLGRWTTRLIHQPLPMDRPPRPPGRRRITGHSRTLPAASARGTVRPLECEHTFCTSLWTLPAASARGTVRPLECEHTFCTSLSRRPYGTARAADAAHRLRSAGAHRSSGTNAGRAGAKSTNSWGRD
jgi:hypothetical protein